MQLQFESDSSLDTSVSFRDLVDKIRSPVPCYWTGSRHLKMLTPNVHVHISLKHYTIIITSSNHNPPERHGSSLPCPPTFPPLNPFSPFLKYIKYAHVIHILLSIPEGKRQVFGIFWTQNSIDSCTEHIIYCTIALFVTNRDLVSYILLLTGIERIKLFEVNLWRIRENIWCVHNFFDLNITERRKSWQTRKGI